MTRIALAVLALLTFAAGAAQAQGGRSGMGPCRQGALALIRMLDDNEDNTADYRNSYEAVTQTCGPVGAARPAPPARPRGECRDLALKVLDVIEDGKMNSQAFVQARDAFKASCGPR